ncbi:MAG: RNA polymerase sigma factor [Oscillospiraceae bacterium]
MPDISKDKSLTLFIKENQNSFYRVAYSYVKNPDTALDLVQDAIVKALQKRDTLKKEEYIKTWFYRILINECLMHLRKNKKIVFLNDMYDYDPVDNSTYNQDDVHELYKAIENLEPKLKTIIILRFFEDLKIEEIAKITDSNVNTVKSRLYKALNILKLKVEDYY